MSKCTDADKFDSDRRLVKFFEDQMAKDGFDRQFGTDDQNPKVSSAISKVLNFLKGKRLTGVKKQKSIQAAINKHVNPQKNEQMNLALEINSRIKANPLIQEMMFHEMIREADKFQRDSKIEWITLDNLERVPRLETIPVTGLRVLRWKVYNALNTGKMFQNNRGLIGNLQYEWGSPRQMALKDPSGLMFAVNQVTERYTYDAQKYANSFIYPPFSKRAQKIRNFGIESISSEIIDVGRTLNIPRPAAFKLFSEIMNGRTLITKTGHLISHKKEVKSPDGTWFWQGETAFTYYDDDGDVQVLKKVDQQKDMFGEDSVYDNLIEQVKQARQLFQEIGREMVAQIDNTSKEETALLAAAKKAGLQEWLQGHIGHMLDGDMEIAGLNAGKMVSGEKYYPRMWYKALVPIEFENAIVAQKAQIDKKRLALRNPDSKLNAFTRNRILKEIAGHEGSIVMLEEKLGYIQNPETPIDLETQTPVNTRVWYKNFKHLTRIMNPDYMRNDEDVMDDYINELSRSVKRNQAVIKVGKALLKAKINGANDNTIDASMGIFNTTFYSPQASSQFMGIDMNPNKISRDLASAGINISGRALTNFFNGLSAYTTINLLHGQLQGLVNYSAAFLKIDRVGKELFLEASRQMMDGKTRDFWKKLSNQAGMETFSQFVGTYFNRALRPNERAANRGAIDRLTALIDEADKTGKVDKLIKWRQQRKNLKSGRIKAILDQGAQFAITRTLSYKANASALGEQLGVAGHILKLMPSINDTENTLRSTSFVIGALHAVQSGRAKNVKSKEAIEAGIDFAMATDFGLSHQHVGAALRGPIAGSTINKMKIWHNQKIGFNWRLWRNHLLSVTPNLKPPTSRSNKAYNTIQLGVSMAKVPFNINILPSSKKATRLVNPYQASNQSNFIREGLVTMLFDFIIFAPGTTHWMARQGKKTYFANPLAKGMSGLANGQISAMIAMTLFVKNLLTGFIGGDKDEKGDEYHPFQKILRALPLGIGGMSAIAGVQHLWTKMFDKDEAERRNKNMFEDHEKRAVSPYYPFGTSGYNIHQGVKKGYKTYVDRRYLK